MSELELRIARAGELRAWLEVPGWDDIRRLAIDIVDPRPYDDLVAFLRAPVLAGIEALAIGCRWPLPARVIDAIVAMNLVELELDAFDPQVVQLATAPRLTKLSFGFSRLSVDAIRALAGASFAPGLRELYVFARHDDRMVEALLAGAWPALVKLGIGVHPDDPPARIAELRARFELIDLPNPEAVARTQPELVAELRACLDRRRFADVLAVLADIDDELYETELAGACEAALATWPTRDRAGHAVGRPYASLIRYAELRTDADVARLHAAIEHVFVADAAALGGVDLAAACPALVTLEVRDRIGYLLDHWRLPGSIAELDLSDYLGELFPRDGYIPPFRDKLDVRLPLLRRVRLPSWCAGNFEVRWRFGACGRDGWYTLR